MRLIVLVISCLLYLNSFGQKQINSKLRSIDENSYYIITEDTNRKVLIFLHGGAKNPYFKKASGSITVDYILEDNQEFLAQSSKNGFDLIIPITNDSLNWLEHPNRSFSILKRMINLVTNDYENVYISGFSDGGTGSFKIFYNNPEYFDGLIVFNGYPQHNNYYKTVDYKAIMNKKILFFSTYKDKVIPYEFLLAEYCSQKKSNPNTFFYLASGGHSFSSYSKEDINEVFDILTNENENNNNYPIQGFIKNDELITLYQFRKKILRKYGFGREIYKANREQHKKWK